MKNKVANMQAGVIVPLPVDEPFTYAVPPELQALVRPGVMVIVPFGQRYESGIVLSTSTGGPDPDVKLKEIYDVVHPQPVAEEEMRRLLEWISQYYICLLGEAYRLLNLNRLLRRSGLRVRRNSDAEPRLTAALRELYHLLPTGAWVDLKSLQKMSGSKDVLRQVLALRRRNLVETSYAPPRSRKVLKTVETFSLNPVEVWDGQLREKYSTDGSARYARARELLKLLKERGPLTRKEIAGERFSSGLLGRLVDEGVVCRKNREVNREQAVHFAEPSAEVTVTDSQLEFVAKVAPYLGEAGRFRAFLLHGITGSGKTQIYIELIQKVLELGRQAIVLIPEIVLTPQTAARFRNRFGEQVAVIHSRISEAERLEVLQRIRDGEFSIAIGPRSAVFAPFRKLGIIIVDEEHEGSYKQSDALPRYNARDVALYRAHLNSIPVVLGSATPSMESLHNALSGKYEYFHLDSRIGARSLPRTMLVDSRMEWRRTGGFPIFSENLMLKMEARLVTREQAMLLQNRRGFSPYIQCQDCGYVHKCPNCDITLTYHSAGKEMRCHYCGLAEPAPDQCPKCQGADILYRGVGTQMIEKEAKTHFPHGRIIRMDQDTTRRRHDHARILEQFRNYRADFLIGTKMIAKGLDFGRVTLVGIINADQGLHFPDFRSAEKVFQLLVQAAGRAGRGAHSGEVVIQTFEPGHYLFKFLLTHDYLKFYEREIESRRELFYPPFSRLCLLRLIGEDEQKVIHYGRELARFLWRNGGAKDVRILGPAPAPLARLNNRYRYHILIKGSRETDPSMSRIRRILKERIYKNAEVKKWPVEIQIDMDPLDIL